ncbi:MAG: SAM-dependent methyltransferase [Actinomycetia bacterium]|nr:SAM-dependent methyltransferase [Actinomycetes bacterium]
MSPEPLHRRASFDRVSDVYHGIRPGYPAPLFDVLFGLLPARPRILEVGPGTGQATRDLLRHDAKVHAIELGPALATRLREELPSPDLTVTVGDFEQIPMEDRAYDAIFSATAYHWIAPHAQLDRPAQLLTPGGLLAVVDLIQVNSDDDRGFFDAAQPIYDRYGEGHHGPPAPPRHRVDPPMRQLLERDRRFESVTVRRYDWDQTYSAAEYRQLMLSYSATQAMEPDARAGLLDDIEAFVVQRFDGEVTRPLVVTLTTAARTAEEAGVPAIGGNQPNVC